MRHLLNDRGTGALRFVEWAGLALLLAGAAWSAHVIAEVARLRGALEHEVSGLSGLQRMSARLTQLDAEAPPIDTGPLAAELAAEVERLPADLSAARRRSVDRLVEVYRGGGAVVRDAGAAAAARALAALDGAIRDRRMRARDLSVELGRSWTAMTGIAWGAIALAGLVGVLLVRSRARTGQLHRLAVALERELNARNDAHAALDVSRESALRIAAASDDGLWTWDLAADRMTLSAQWKRQLGLGPGEVGDQLESWLGRVHPDDEPELRAALTRMRRGEIERLDREYRLRHADGRYRRFLARGHAVAGVRGHVERIVGLQVDITERQRVARMRQEIISIVSHELRTPLTCILGPLSLLRGHVGAGGEELLEMAERATARLVKVVDQVCDLGTALDEGVELELQPVDLRLTIEVLLKEAERRLGERQLRVEREVPSVWVQADRGSLERSLRALVDNAIKFSPDGGRVEIVAAVDGERVRVEVGDEGEGVPAELREALFEPFSQQDSSDTRAKDGMGLGLAVARHLSRQMGGDVGLTAQPAGPDGSRRGSRFWLELPLAPHARVTQPVSAGLPC